MAPPIITQVGRWESVEEWRREARARVLDRIAPVDLGGTPEVTVTSRHTFDGLDFERLTWQLPAGPPTEAVFITPSGTTGPLPGILALHDHAGKYTLAEMQRADSILRETSEGAGAADRYRCNFYEGGHKFDRAMQADAFDWFDRFLRDD